MKAPICNFCLKSGILCSKCEEKLRSGLISELDVRVARALLKLEGGHPTLQDVHFHKALEVDGLLAILVDRDDVSRIRGEGAQAIRALSEATGKRVKLIERGRDLRKFLEGLLAPAAILTINTVWLPDRTTETKVILRERDMKRLPASVDALKRLAREMQGVTLRVEVEERL